MIFRICLKQNKTNARTALQMYCKIIEMIHMYQIKPTYLNTDTTKLNLYTRVPMTVEMEPPTGADWKQTKEISMFCQLIHVYPSNIYVYSPRTEFTIGGSYLKMNQRSQKTYTIIG